MSLSRDEIQRIEQEIADTRDGPGATAQGPGRRGRGAGASAAGAASSAPRWKSASASSERQQRQQEATRRPRSPWPRSRNGWRGLRPSTTSVAADLPAAAPGIGAGRAGAARPQDAPGRKPAHHAERLGQPGPLVSRKGDSPKSQVAAADRASASCSVRNGMRLASKPRRSATNGGTQQEQRTPASWRSTTCATAATRWCDGCARITRSTWPRYASADAGQAPRALPPLDAHGRPTRRSTSCAASSSRLGSVNLEALQELQRTGDAGRRRCRRSSTT